MSARGSPRHTHQLHRYPPPLPTAQPLPKGTILHSPLHSHPARFPCLETRVGSLSSAISDDLHPKGLESRVFFLMLIQTTDVPITLSSQTSLCSVYSVCSQLFLRGGTSDSATPCLSLAWLSSTQVSTELTPSCREST